MLFSLQEVPTISWNDLWKQDYFCSRFESESLSEDSLNISIAPETDSELVFQGAVREFMSEKRLPTVEGCIVD